MSYLPQHKYGFCNCGECPADEEVAGRKIGKDFMCLPSYNRMKTLEQVGKANKRKALRIDNGKIRKLVPQNKISSEDIGTQQLKNDLDAVFSLYIRLKYANPEGIVTCYTCDEPFHYKDIQNGHFVKRGSNATRFEEANNRPQCPRCNQLHNEDESIYERKLEEETPGITAYLREQGALFYKFTRDELKQLLIAYTEKLRLVKSKLFQQ